MGERFVVFGPYPIIANEHLPSRNPAADGRCGHSGVLLPMDGGWRREARRTVSELFKRDHHVYMVGGDNTKSGHINKTQSTLCVLYKLLS